MSSRFPAPYSRAHQHSLYSSRRRNQQRTFTESSNAVSSLQASLSLLSALAALGVEVEEEVVLEFGLRPGRGGLESISSALRGTQAFSRLWVTARAGGKEARDSTTPLHPWTASPFTLGSKRYHDLSMKPPFYIIVNGGGEIEARTCCRRGVSIGGSSRRTAECPARRGGWASKFASAPGTSTPPPTWFSDPRIRTPFKIVCAHSQRPVAHRHSLSPGLLLARHSHPSSTEFHPPSPTSILTPVFTFQPSSPTYKLRSRSLPLP
ncbi:hypothetical protein R3P38DRAFT_3415414 [Favolaschia claudopus]|uniref:Uncharacterized protein n=1 Tax=Favolaschia claudopus TaxID=2862362 RepID=A0AAW0ECV3_9AGAR